MVIMAMKRARIIIVVSVVVALCRGIWPLRETMDEEVYCVFYDIEHDEIFLINCGFWAGMLSLLRDKILYLGML